MLSVAKFDEFQTEKLLNKIIGPHTQGSTVGRPILAIISITIIYQFEYMVVYVLLCIYTY